MNRILLSSILLSQAFIYSFDACAEVKPDDTQYGVCAHLSRWEFDKANEETLLMREAGIKFFRTDFDVRAKKSSDGKIIYDFSKWENLYDIVSKNGVSVLPIIPGSRPAWMNPLAENTDKVADFVAQAVTNFKGKIKYWEIVNEPNLESFWGSKPNPAEYAKVLEASYKAVKKANPDAVVLYAGVAGVPLKYIEDSYKAGAGKYFDVMNIHPYQWQGLPESGLIREISQLKELMAKYGLSDKPIWITEVGNSSGTLNPMTSQIMDNALKYLGIDQKNTTIVVIEDEKYSYLSYKNRGSLEDILDNPKAEKKIKFDEIKNLSVEEYPVLVISPSEDFPYLYLGDLYDYMAKGGTIVSAGGFPFYYDLELLPDGKINRIAKNIRGSKMMRLGEPSTELPIASVKDRPRVMSKFEVAKGFESIKPAGVFNSFRFIVPKDLKGNDKFIPIVYGYCKDIKAPIAGIYKFDSDIKGNFIHISTFLDQVIPEPQQAKIIARTMLVSYAMGIQKLFLYSFRSQEFDNTREAHFGIIRKNLEKKPAYFAYQTVAKMLGEGVKPNMKVEGDVYMLDWVRADGTKVVAIWRLFDGDVKNFTVKGKVKAAYNHLGEKIKLKNKGKKLSVNLNGGGVIYLEGLESIELR